VSGMQAQSKSRGKDMNYPGSGALSGVTMPNNRRWIGYRTSRSPVVTLVLSIGLLVGTTFGMLALSSGIASASTHIHWSIVPTPGGDIPEFLAVSCTTVSSCVGVGERGPFGPALAEAWNGASWTVNPPAITAGILSGVSCVAADDCVAVGYLTDFPNSPCPSFSTSAVAESWNGTSWSVLPTPSVDANCNSLTAVSCLNANYCVAVGSEGASPTQTLVETWNGAAWSVVASPNPDPSFDYLSSVSCTSSTNCVAVGGLYTSPYHDALIETWDGSTWTAASYFLEHWT